MARVMDVKHGEQMEPWFLEMSPRGELPVLRHGDNVLLDVDKMMTYVDNLSPGQENCMKLFPDKNTELGSNVMRIFKELSKINIPLIVYGTLFHPEICTSSATSDEENKRKAAMVKQGKSQIVELMERNPDYANSYVEKQKAYESFLALAQSDGAVAKELDEVEKVLDLAEELLTTKKSPGTTTPEVTQIWLFSIYITAADVYLMVLLHAVYKACLWERYFEKSRRRKQLAKYFKKMKHDPLVTKALPGLIK
ncbi:ganglioside-induced differentiation-associated protein 1-like isoform X3 [Ornithodoros turicata]